MKKQNHPFNALIPAVVLFLSLAQAGLSQTVTRTFTSNGSFVVPAGVTSVLVECWGAGGGGSTITANGRRGGGGGGGAYASGVLTVIPGNSYAVAVGAGGGPSAAGGNSSFNTNSVVAAGGTGGTNNNTAAGAGGTVAASTGTTRYAGGNGANGDVTTNFSGGGGGGAGSSGTGVNATGSTGGAATAANGGSGGSGVSGSLDGQPGNNYGGGGSGAVTNSGSDRNGGSGAAGLVIITWTRPVFYSYQTGPWNTISTWTFDPSGTLKTGNEIPADFDRVVILTDRTVTLTGDISTTGLDISIMAGGTINMAGYRFINAFASFTGQGTLKLASANFPVATSNTFVNAGGGTTEYYNSSAFTLPASQGIYNNLTINTTGAIATQLNSLTLNGNLSIQSGTFRINDNTGTAKLSLTIAGNVTVDNGASFTVGNGVTNPTIGGTGGAAPFTNYYLNFHSVVISGDFTNNGTVRFTNLAYPLYTAFPPTTAGATSGAASVWFQGAADKTLTCNGTTDFYNLIVNKGTDQTFKLTINSGSYSNFRLFGANSLAAETVTGNPTLRKALWIYNGTLVLKGNLVIPSLTEGVAANADYYIPASGALVVDGVDVVILSTADDYREINAAYGVSIPDNVSAGITTGGNSALYVFGKLQINNGFLSTRESGGLVTSSVASGQIIVNGGTVDAKQFLSATGTASYAQSDGLFILRGRFQRTPVAYTSVSNLSDVTTATLNTARSAGGTSATNGSFNLENTGNIYSVSGGVIRIYDVTTTGIGEAFDVRSSAANINVTGGTVEIIPTAGTLLADASDYSVYSTAPVFNLTVNRTGSISAVRMETQLTVLNNLNLLSGSLNANGNNLSIGRNFTVEAGTTYSTGSNITIFNGPAPSVFTVNTAAPLSLSSLTFDKPAGVTSSLAGLQNMLTVSREFRLVAGTLNDGGKTVGIAGNVFNNGIHTGTGKLVLNGSAAQTIAGGGRFQNIELDNSAAAAAPVTLAADMTLNGTLTFSRDKLFGIGTFNLHLNAAATIVNGGAARFVQTAGNAGDGGLSRAYASINPFTFPVGVAGKYTPATIGFTTAPSTFGSVAIIPVDYEHPLTSVKNQSLTYFWRIKSAGFTGIPLFAVTHEFVYNQSDVAGAEAGYIPSLYDGIANTWYSGSGSGINTATNTISDWTSPTNSTNFLDADYSAGVVSSFGTPVRYYSRQSGLWSSTTTWSRTGHTVDNPPATAPGANDIVIIGGNDSIYLSAEAFPLPNDNNPLASYFQLNKAIVNCATLQIENGSVLDIQNNPGCTFASVLTHPGGNGKLRLSTRDAGAFDSPEPFVYPNGDFSEFSAYNGVSDFYTVNPQAGRYYTLPSNASDYGTVILTPLGGSNIIMPNIPLVTIHGNLICNGSNADAWLAMTWNGEYLPIVAKTVNVAGDLIVSGGSFGFIYNGATLQQININGDVRVSPNSAIDVWATSTNNVMQIGGNIYNNSNYGSNTLSLVRFLNGTQKCDITFFGNSSTVVTNDPAISTTPRTVFGNVTVNKGTIPDTTLTWNIGGTLVTPADNWLTLQNGTLIYGRTGNFNVSTTTDFVIPATAGLTLNTPSDVYISNNASSETLFLNGRLRMLSGGGNVYIGPAGNVANNADIEYSGSGASLVEIQSGNLFVNGQIRRPLATTNGILTYRQSGGNVIVYGNNPTAANLIKAKLEVLNDASEFTMSGGTVTIVRGGGTTFGDLYLRPSSGTVTGGTVIFSQSPVPGTAVDADQSYLMDVNIPLNNLTVTGKTAATARDATLSLMVSPLVLNGSVTLSNIRSFLASNNRNISIMGDFNNSGTYNFGTNKTVFNGGIQAVLGLSVTSFYDLEVTPVTSLTVNRSFTVNRNLDIISGNLVLGTTRVSLRGSLTNNGAWTDDNVNGGISLEGTALQQIYGTGSFGRLLLNNATGARTNNDITLQNDLVMTTGILDINKYLLTLGQNSLISGVSFSATKMIKTDGVASSRGLLKFFPATPQIFTFPTGVSGKYTPGVLTVTASATVGSVRINPVNERHPNVTDPLNALGYYWQVESSGITGFNASLVLQYLTNDVNGAENNYVAARLVLPGDTWVKAPAGPSTDNVDEINHRITFNYTATNNLNGDYTAGAVNAIPDVVPSYITNNNGVWSDQSIWTPVGASPPCPSDGPRGSNIFISHTVTTDINYISVLNTTVNGELRVVSPTFGHNLGNVDGDGKLYLESGNLPGGSYTGFTDCSGNGTLEYGGTGTYTLVSGQYTSVPNLFVTGSGIRIIPNIDLTVCKRLVIDGPLLDNSANNRRIIIRGTIERYGSGAFRSGSGSYPLSSVSFAGSSLQALGGTTGDFTGASRFNNIEINNPAGLNISGITEVSNQLFLTNGVINTSAAGSLILLNTSTAAVSPEGGSSASFVSGPLTKYIVNGDIFLYPLGRGALRGHRFILTSTAGSTVSWTAENFAPNTTATSIAPPLQVSNTQEYWNVSSAAPVTARIKIGWDPQSELTPLMTVNGITDLRVAEYAAGVWNERPSVATGNNSTGEVATTVSVNISSTPAGFTTASITGTLARASFASFAPICGTPGIPVSFISFTPINLNYILSYTINGVAQSDVTVTSLPFTLPATIPGAYRLTGFRFNNGSGTGVVDVTTVNVFALPTTAAAGSDQSLCGLSSTTLGGNSPVPYSGRWTVVSGAGGSFANSVLYNTVFTGVLGVSYTLRWTISNGPCTSSDDVVVSFPVVASQPGDFTSGATQACRGSVGNVYSVPFVSGVTYAWSYSGTGHTINGTGNSVTLDFSTVATGGILSVTATNACGTSAARTISVTVPSADFSYTGSPWCQNAANPTPVMGPGAVAGTFSSTAGLVFADPLTGQINLAASRSGTYTVTNTITVAGCGTLTSTGAVTVSGLAWTGSVSTDWNVPGNWSCGFVPYPSTAVQVPDVTNDPVINTGFTGDAGNITFESGSSLTVNAGSLRISGTVSGSGNLIASGGSVEFNGTAAQVIGNNIFSTNTVRNLIINNAAGVTLQGPLSITGSVVVTNGNLASDGFLTLVSTAAGTAYVDGGGAGNITGNVTMQRYLPSVYGYKYFSSPFQAATVGEFGDDMNLASSFPLFYRYDEARTSSGWVGYANAANLLIPLRGYSVNFGVAGTPGTVDVSGVVNNSPLSLTLMNNDSTYTKGFNLVGNPYPSAIDWSAAGWTKTNIDNAVYYFRASTTDQYGGTYSSYVNGISTDPGIATNIIPSMQGFFVHVSDGSYPVTGTLSLDNSVRVNDRTHNFLKSAEASDRFLIRATASFTDDAASSDPTVIYFTTGASPEFEGSLDALKLLNTDMLVANVYSVLDGGTRLSVNALPESADTALVVPLGLRTNRDGEITFRLRDLENLPGGVRVYFRDKATGANVNMLPDRDYKIVLTAGTYNDRFSIAFLKSTTGIEEPEASSDLFTAYASKGLVRATVWALENNEGVFTVYDLSGQPLFVKKVYERGRLEFNSRVKPGIYIVSFVTGNRRGSLKMSLGF